MWGEYVAAKKLLRGVFISEKGGERRGGICADVKTTHTFPGLFYFVTFVPQRKRERKLYYPLNNHAPLHRLFISICK